MSGTATWDDFVKIDMRAGTIIAADDFPEARVPAYKLTIDLGELGIKKSSARMTKNYRKEDIIGKQVICVVNFPKKQIGNFFSEVLIMGVYSGSYQNVVLLAADKKVNNGDKVG